MTARVSNRQTFPIRAATYWRDVWLNIPFLQQLYCGEMGFVAVELIEQQGDLERGMKRRLRMHKPIQGPTAVQKVLGTVMILDEESEFDPAAQCWRYRVVPSRLADRLDVSGSVTLQESADGIEEQTADELTFHMFGVSSLIEPYMARETKQAHVQRIEYIQRYITQKQLR